MSVAPISHRRRRRRIALRAKRAIARGETARWREIAEAAGNFIWTRDPAGRITWVNQRWIEFTRLPAELAKTMDGWVQVIHPDDIARVVPSIDAALRAGRPFEVEHRVKPAGAPDSEYRWMLARSIPTFDATGALVGWIGTSTKMRDRPNETDRRQRDLERLAETIPQIVWQTSADGKLLYANSRWFEYSGLTTEQTINGGWLAALHPDDVDRTRTAWARAVADGSSYNLEYRIRGIDGVHRWFLVRADSIRSADGSVSSWLGTSTNVDERRRIEQAARFSYEAMAQLGHSPDIVQTCRRIARRAVDRVADFCIFDIARPNGTIERLAWGHRDPARAARMAECVNYPLAQRPKLPGPIRRALTDGTGHVVHRWTDEHSIQAAYSDDHLAFLRWLDISSLVAIPLVGARETLGVLTLGRANGSDYYEKSEIEAFYDIGRRIGLALEATRSSERNRAVAERFGRAALPKSLPSVAGVAFDAIYEPVGGTYEVGGDWYDAFVLADGSIVLSIGDVTGHGLDAAITMNAVRQSIRTAALFSPDPAQMIGVAAAALRAESADRYVTAFVAHLAIDCGRLRYASAGHPPPFVRRSNGRVETLDRTMMMLGVDETSAEPSAPSEITLARGDMLVLYTDGLIEAQRDIEAAFATFRTLLAGDTIALARRPAGLIRDTLLQSASDDDVAILVLTVETTDRWVFDALDAEAARGARVGFARYLATACTVESDILGAETIFGELVGNVVRYAPGPIEITLEWAGSQATLHVMDRGPGFVWHTARLPDENDERGRGLFIVAALATHVEIRRVSETGGTHAVAGLPVERAPR